MSKLKKNERVSHTNQLVASPENVDYLATLGLHSFRCPSTRINLTLYMGHAFSAHHVSTISQCKFAAMPGDWSYM